MSRPTHRPRTRRIALDALDSEIAAVERLKEGLGAPSTAAVLRALIRRADDVLAGDPLSRNAAPLTRDDLLAELDRAVRDGSVQAMRLRMQLLEKDDRPGIGGSVIAQLAARKAKADPS